VGVDGHRPDFWIWDEVGKVTPEQWAALQGRGDLLPRRLDGPRPTVFELPPSEVRKIARGDGKGGLLDEPLRIVERPATPQEMGFTEEEIREADEMIRRMLGGR